MNKAQQERFGRRLSRIVRCVDHTGRPGLMFKWRLNSEGAVIWVGDWVVDVVTGKSGLLTGAEWFVDPQYSEEGVVRLAFRIIEAFEQHELREHFLYKGKRVFSPHKVLI